MITEFLGISGVGKSTMAREYYKNNENIEWPRFNLYEKNNWLMRNIRKSIDVMCYLLFHLKWTNSFLKILNKTGISSLKNKASILFNGIHLKSMLSKCKDNKKEYIFDEGVYQFIWAIYLRSKELPRKELVEELLEAFQVPNKLIIVDARDEIIKDRLLKRGRKTKILDTSDLMESISKNKKNLSLIMEYSKEKIQDYSCIVEYIDCNEEINK